jgi:DNA-binding beta-propeller fold protein YncE
MVFFVTVMVAGCTVAEKTLRFEMPVLDPDHRNRLMWPEPPAIPRYVYVGDLIGEQNYKSNATGQAVTGLSRVIDVIVGVANEPANSVSLQRPQGITIDSLGRILVSDISREAIFVFDKNRGQLQVWDDIGGGRHLQSPIGLEEFEGTVYVADSILGRVFRFSLEGKFLGSIDSGELKRPTGIAINREKRLLYVADTANNNIKVFDLDGSLVQTIGSRGAGAVEFNAPTYLTFAGNKLYVSDTLNARVQVLSETGELISEIGQRGLYVGNMTRPKGVAVDSEGIIYVVESYYDHLLIFDAEGKFLLPIGGSGYSAGTFFQPAGIFVDPSGMIYVADMFNGRVAIFQYLGDGIDGL